MSLNAIATPAAREPGPLVTRWRSRTVAKVDSMCAMVIVAPKSGREFRAQVRTTTRRPRRRPRLRSGCLHPAQMRGVDAVQDPPGGRHRGEGAEQVLPITQRADAADRVRAVRDRDRQIAKHPTRGVQRHPSVGVDQRPADPADQAGRLGHLPQQPDPGMRHDTRAVRADLDPARQPSTLHLRSAFLWGILGPSQVQVSLTGQAFPSI